MLYTFCAQSQSVVLVEHFTETGCGACMQNDSAFNAVINANPEKVIVISYHCFYANDPFYKYNKDGFRSIRSNYWFNCLMYSLLVSIIRLQ